MPKLGWLPDPPKGPQEPRDFDAATMLGVAPPPPSASLRHLIVDVLDQGRLAACVSHAGLQAIRANHVRQGAAAPKLGSRLFAYYLSRAYHHMTGLDSGTHLRTLFMALNKFGFPPESAWPYDDDPNGAFKRMPPTRAFQQAFDQRSPTTYRRIYDTGADRIDAIKRANAAGFVVTFGTDVDRAFVRGEFDASKPLLPPRSDIVGGHALCIIGYDGDVFDICNSWGRRWADGGLCKFSAEYLAAPSSRDFWIVEHSPRYS